MVLIFILFAALGAQEKSELLRAGIINGRATYLPVPEYPQAARDFCAREKVEIDVLVGESGEVIEAEAISGDELLRDVSVKAVKKAKFLPTHGVPVKYRGIVVYNFDGFAKCISAGIVNKKAVKLPKPKLDVRSPEKELIAAVRIIVDMDGKVTAARALNGHPLIRVAIENAARQARFSPTFINGPPVRVRALLVYKFKPGGSVETDVEKDDKDVIKTPVSLIEPASPSCNCRGLGGAVLVEAKIDERGNVVQANAYSGHPVLRKLSENAALASKFLPSNFKAKILISYNFEALDKDGRAAKFKDFEIKSVEIEK